MKTEGEAAEERARVNNKEETGEAAANKEAHWELRRKENGRQVNWEQSAKPGRSEKEHPAQMTIFK